MNINGDMIIYDDLEKNQHEVLKDIVALLNHRCISTILLGVDKKNPNISMGSHHPSWILALNTWIEQERIVPNPVNNIKISQINGILDIEITPGNDAPYHLTAKNDKNKQRIYIRDSKKTKPVSPSEYLQLYSHK